MKERNTFFVNIECNLRIDIVTIKAKSFEAPYYKINSNSGNGTTQNSVIAKDAVYSSPEIILSDIKPNDIIAAGKATYNHKELEKPSSTINAE